MTASLFRKYDLYREEENVVDGEGTKKNQGPALALYDTIRERDVDLVADLTVPGHAVGSKGVRVLVK